MIVSFFDGRIRIRREELKNPETMDVVATLIRSQDGILELVPNHKTGSLVVVYDPEKVPRETLLDAATTLENQFALVEKKAKKSTKKLSRKDGKRLSPLAETGLLVGLYSLTLLSGFVSKRVHVLGALLFTGAAAAHVYTRRRLL